MELPHILKSLIHNKAAFVLLALQVAITLAVLVNALALVKRSKEIIDEPNGMDSQNIIAILSIPFDQQFSDESYMQARLREDLDYLRRMPGVVNATTLNSIPGDIGSNNGIYADGNDSRTGTSAGTFSADEHTFDTLGVEIVAGRNFLPEEVFYSSWPPSDEKLPQIIVITGKLARHLFGDETAVGKSVTAVGLKKTVIGVVDLFRGRNPILGDSQMNMFMPGYNSGRKTSSTYLVRTESGLVDPLIADIEEKLLELNDGRDINEINPLTDNLANATGVQAYGGLVLLAISGLLVVTTALGIYGMASFAVTKRIKQIGTRRALGATRTAIVRYFVLENLLSTGAGIVLGSGLAIALNMVMMDLGLGRADLMVTTWGIVFVLVVGQASVLIPAYRASLISPAEATRCL
tara:strand:- start:139 stop:1359 length:1221 start_codon:yes stop_codon:yes gene_type:complete